ncbi:uncharacterized protein LOC144662280 isoform X2 [Oculina patagonica]
MSAEPAAPAIKGCPTPLDVITALDASGSVLKENWEKSVDFAAQLANQLIALNTDSRMGVIDFSAVANEAIPPSNDQTFLKQELGNLKNSYQNGITRTELALKKASEIFLRINRASAKKLLIIVTDGRTTPLNNMQGVELLQEPVENLKKEGVHVMAVGVGDLINNDELNFMATDPNNENVFHIDDYDKLVNIVDTISKAVCTTKAPQSPTLSIAPPPEPDNPTCAAVYTKVGCLKDDLRSPRPLPELLFTDRDPSVKKYSNISIGWQNWNSYMSDLVCRCAKEAKVRNFAYFSIQFYGECWSGPKAGETYNRAGHVNTCVTRDYQECDASDSRECVGEKATNFVYEVDLAVAEPTCNVKYQKLGCFKDTAKKPRLLEKLILTDRDPKSRVFSNVSVDWGNWDSYMPSLACRCAKKAAENKYTYFGLQHYGECWSGPDAGETYDKLGPAAERRCVTSGYRPCPKDPKATEKECVGKNNVNYVYAIEKNKDASCSVPFTPVGCFNDNQQKHGRPLPELLITDRDMNSVKYSGIKVNWGEWDTYMNDIICRCAKKAKEMKYSHFGIQNYGECWSGPEAGGTFSSDGPSKPEECAGRGFKTCDILSHEICTGKEKTNFVYSV